MLPWIKARAQELSSHMGVLVIAAGFFIGTKVNPADPTASVPELLKIAGMFGIAIPEQSQIVSTESVLALMRTAVADVLASGSRAGLVPPAPPAPGATTMGTWFAWLAPIGIGLALCSCSPLEQIQPAPKDPAQAVFQVEGDYAAALSLAAKYSQLPACGSPTSPAVCADAAVVVKLRQADGVAWAAIQSAQSVVRTPGLGQDQLADAVTIASNAVQAFAAIATQLGVK